MWVWRKSLYNKVEILEISEIWEISEIYKIWKGKSLCKKVEILEIFEIGRVFGDTKRLDLEEKPVQWSRDFRDFGDL